LSGFIRPPCLPGGRSGFRRLALPALAWIALAALACGEPAQTPAPPEAPAPAAQPAARRGLWVLAEGSQRVLEHPERVDALLADARALGATDLFVQVYRGGRAWFDSSHADAAPWRAARDAAGRDPLAALIERASAAGLRVHAWVNVLSLSTNRKAPIAAALGPAAIQVDRQGRSLLDYADFEVPQPDRRHVRMGTPGLYLDPGAPGVAPALVAAFAELCARYPALDGLHLDYIRYPDVLPFAPGTRFGVGLDFGYGAATRARFRAETGLEAPFRESIRNANAWDAWRREQVDALVREISAAARAADPGLELSAAVFSYADRAYLTIGQDWRRWLEEDRIDFAVPMAYTQDDRLLRYQTEAFVGTPLAPRIWVGLGTWLFAERPEGALRQLEILRAAGAANHALFSWDSIADAPALRDALAAAADAG
jgi:uncharacterized lipoprotein YddW (UPF0748 family)